MDGKIESPRNQSGIENQGQSSDSDSENSDGVDVEEIEDYNPAAEESEVEDDDDDEGNGTDWTISIPNSPEQEEEEEKEEQGPILNPEWDDSPPPSPRPLSRSRSPPPALNNSPALTLRRNQGARETVTTSGGDLDSDLAMFTSSAAKRSKISFDDEDDSDEFGDEELRRRSPSHFSKEMKHIISNGTNEFAPQIKQKTILCQDLEKLWASKELSDIVFQCEEGELKAHKLIVAARSEVFNAMFASGMSESTSNVVKIDDIKLSILKILVQFMYTGVVEPLTIADTSDLLRAADKYQMERLKIACFQNLVRMIKLTNVGNLLMLAHIHNAPASIKLKIQEYVIRMRVELGKVNEFRAVADANPDVLIAFIFDTFITSTNGQLVNMDLN